jgi:hypothetical protein
MAKHKVNEQAVQAQFLDIVSLMQGLCQKMGPQTWQGGSAGRFTGELIRNNQALASMMDNVWQVVKRVNKDNPPAPPSMPSVQPQMVNGAIASLNPDLADALAAELGDVADSLPGHGSRLANLLEQGGAGVSTNACSSVAAWCRSQIKTMHQRAEYARASDKVGKHVDFAYPGQSPIPDVDKFGSAEMAKLGKLQAQLLNQDIEHPTAGAPEDLANIGANLKENAKDPNFRHAFFGAGGVKSGYIAKIPYWLHQNNKDEKGKRCVPAGKVMADFGTALAALSRRKDPESQLDVRNALGKDDSDMPGRGLLVKYSEGKWGSQVLAELGAEALRWRAQHPSYKLMWPHKQTNPNDYRVLDNNGGPKEDSWWFDAWGVDSYDKKQLIALDPALNIFHKINATHDAAAARILANTPADDVKLGNPPGMSGSLGEDPSFARLLIAPDWLDGGKEAGGIVSLATHQTPTMDPHDKHEAARAARKIMKATSDWNVTYRSKLPNYLKPNSETMKMLGINADKPDLGEGLRQSLGNVAKEYIPSIAQATGKDTGHRLGEDPVTHTVYADINRDVAEGFLQSVVTDQTMRRDLLAAAVIYNRESVKYALTHHNSRFSPHEVANFAGWAHKNIFDAYKATVISEATDKDAAKTNLIKDLALANTVATTILTTATGGAPVVSAGINLGSVAVSDVLDKMSPNEKEKAQNRMDDANGDYQQSVADSMLMALHDSGKLARTMTVNDKSEPVDHYFNADGTLNWARIRNRDSDEWVALQNWAAKRGGENLIKTAQGGFAGEQP